MVTKHDTNGDITNYGYHLSPENEGTMLFFPARLRHCVYPFHSTGETRRTLAANCDVSYDPIINKGAHD